MLLKPLRALLPSLHRSSHLKLYRVLVANAANRREGTPESVKPRRLPFNNGTYAQATRSEKAVEKLIEMHPLHMEAFPQIVARVEFAPIKRMHNPNNHPTASFLVLLF
ncbi:MAG: hypothetical protein Q4C41_04265 [Eggerthellaceae bacterium]|nr:hypothetical protein [Eggerthellaceae bacterium]